MMVIPGPGTFGESFLSPLDRELWIDPFRPGGSRGIVYHLRQCMRSHSKAVFAGGFYVVCSFDTSDFAPSSEYPIRLLEIALHYRMDGCRLRRLD